MASGQLPMMNYTEYPLKDIHEPHAHDVLCGRGGGTNNHIGNSHWRMLVAANKQLYITLPKRQKMLLSRSIVNAVRSQNPPGRFLQKDGKTKLWFDVGDQRAQEKTSQALREGAPDIRKKVMASKGDTPSNTTTASTTTPAAPTSGDVSKSGAKRDGGEKPQIPAHSANASAVPFQQRKPESAVSSAVLSQTEGSGMIPPPEPLPYNPQEQQQQMNTMYGGHVASGHMTLNERGMMIQNAMTNGGRSLNHDYEQPLHSANRFQQQQYQQSQQLQQHQFHQQQDYQPQYQHQHQHHNNSVSYQRQRQRQQLYQQDQQQNLHGYSNHSMASSDVSFAAAPPTEGLDKDGLSFGSLHMTDAEMHTLQLGSAHGPSKRQSNRRRRGSNDNNANQNLIPAAPMGGVLEPAGLSIGDVSMHSASMHSFASNYQMKLEENGTSFGTEMSYNTMNTSLHGNNPDMVDGGLIDAVGSSFGSLSLDKNNRDILFKTLEIAGGGSEVPPMFRSETKSSVNLLDCSDTESESSREREVLTKQKSQRWEMMKTQLEKQTSKGHSVDSQDLMPPPVGVPQHTVTNTNSNKNHNNTNHHNAASAADKFDDLVIALPPTTMEANFSTLSAWSAADEESNSNDDDDDDDDSQDDVVAIAPPPPQLTKTDSY